MIWRDRRLRGIAGAAANVNFFGLMVFALLVVYLTREHGFTPVMIAAVTVAGGLGSLAGACGPRVSRRIGRGRTVVLGSAVFGFGMIAFPAAHGRGGWCWSSSRSTRSSSASRSCSSTSPPARSTHRGTRRPVARVNASMSTVTQGVKALGALTGGASGTAYGLRPALWVAAVGATTTVLWTCFHRCARPNEPRRPARRRYRRERAGRGEDADSGRAGRRPPS